MRGASANPSKTALRGPRGAITGQAGSTAVVVHPRYRTRGVRAEPRDDETRIRNDRRSRWQPHQRKPW